VFGAALYACFTFLWSPLHYLHLMFITLFASLGLMLLIGRLAPQSTPPALTATALAS
jgi:SSS family solute:Na+ symporter